MTPPPSEWRSTDITVVIPAHNSAQHIESAIRSVENQIARPSKIIVVENASTDNTNKIVHQCAETSRIPIQIISTDCPGVANARNLGFSLAETSLIAMLDSDDLYEPDFLSLALTAFNVISNLSIFFGNRRPLVDGKIMDQPFLESTNLVSLPFSEVVSDIRLIKGELFSALLHGSFISCSGAVIHKPSAFRVGLFPLHLKSSEDRDFFCRLALKGTAAYTLRMAHLYRIHPGSRTGSTAALESQKNALACLLTLRIELRDHQIAEQLDALENAISEAANKIQYLAAEHGITTYRKTLKWLIGIGSPASRNPFYPLKALKNSFKAGSQPASTKGHNQPR